MGCPIFPHDTQTFRDSAVMALGTILEKGDGTRWQYVEFDTGTGPVAFSSGMFCGWTDRDAFKVTADNSDHGDNPAGAIAATPRVDNDGNTLTDKAPTDGQFGFIQIEGYHPAVRKVAGQDSLAEDSLYVLSGDGTVNDAAAADPALAELNIMVGRGAGASEDTATGTYREDTVPLHIKIVL